MDNTQLIKVVTEAVMKQMCSTLDDRKIPIAISNRHVHLSQQDMDTLFGLDYQFQVIKELSQPEQVAYDEKVTLVGPKGVLENVRILGPYRSKTQVEISIADGFKLGVKAPVKESGDLTNSPGLTLVGPNGSVTISEGTIVAARHIHMHPKDAARFNVKDKDRVNVKVTGQRGLIFNEVLIRVNENYKLEMHIDMDEANAGFLKNNVLGEIFNFN